jgi:hypothetical protein
MAKSNAQPGANLSPEGFMDGSASLALTTTEPVTLWVVDPADEVAPAAGDAVILQLTDLLPDASGEVVLYAEAGVPVNILAHEPVTESGVAEAHVTASGLDVTGLQYYSFEGGLTLYSPSDVLIINDTGAM